jgi:hypothetical protein
LAETLPSRFGAEPVVLSCLVDNGSMSFEAGYNETVEAHMDTMWRPGSVAAVHANVQRRRQEACDAWAASNSSSEGAEGEP